MEEELLSLKDLLDLGFIQPGEYEERKLEIQQKYGKGSNTSNSPNTQTNSNENVPVLVKTPNVQSNNSNNTTELDDTPVPYVPIGKLSPTEYDLAWDSTTGSKSDNLAVKSNGRRLVNKGVSAGCLNIGRAVSGFESGVHCWRILIEKIDPGATVIVGICRASVTRTTHVGAGGNGWGFVSTGQKIFCGSIMKYSETGFKEGDVVGVSVDFNEGKVKFFVNDEDLGYAFSGIQGTIFPAVSVPGPEKGGMSKIIPCLTFV
eukprot:TRINITY_DN3430_c0_g1_i3.p1 TRINITY_DN3430_c0_g1~~TRINITY_DN3430_c0_g1_i3.p1  ORF type:complete len:260 (+),score=62.88 TRINITY_DN3430_c0_g1_i3:104-883(+)